MTLNCLNHNIPQGVTKRFIIQVWRTIWHGCAPIRVLARALPQKVVSRNKKRGAKDKGRQGSPKNGGRWAIRMSARTTEP